MTVEEYLAGEPLAPTRREYVAGDVYALAGGSVDHNQLKHNLERALGNQLEDRPCRVASADQLLRAADDRYYYPDVVVSCDPSDSQPLYQDQPRLVAEVTSESTRRVDHTEKRAAYLLIPSLVAYVLVEQHLMHVSVHRRDGDRWLIETLTEPDDLVRLDSLGFELSLARLYRRTRLDPAAT